MINFIRKVTAVVFGFLFAVIADSEQPVKENYIEPVSTVRYILADAYFHAQGITTDGEYYYFSSNTGLLKTELDAETMVKLNPLAIPARLMLEGCDHLGGISYYNGKIYATTEDSGRFNHLYLIAYDCETLKAVNYKALPLEKHENGAPWCAVDKETGIVYSARRDRFEELNAYNADTLEYMYSVPVTGQPHKIQGGEIYNGILYCSASRQNQAVFAVELSSGKGKLLFERNLADGAEGEGLTILPGEDGAFFRILDIPPLRLGVNLRSYAFNPESIDFGSE